MERTMSELDPFGVNPKQGAIQAVTRRFYQGESISFDIPALLASGTPVTADNATAAFTLKDNQFFLDDLWSADLVEGLSVPAPGVIRVTIPNEVSDLFRRGSFSYTLFVTDKATRKVKLVEEGTLLIEYAAGSPNPDLAYKDLDGDQTSSG